jgi:5-(carboxyamino)imidazole ribonucleotide mutase
MGSSSDWPLVKKAADTFDALGVKYDARVMSAHRTPDALREYVKSARAAGVKVFIGAAGKAAHLPGVIASYTSAPVIGLPIKSSALDGMDALLSMAQMPPGVPVATVAIDGAENAALLAAQILALSDSALSDKLERHRQSMARAVEKSDMDLRSSLHGEKT